MADVAEHPKALTGFRHDVHQVIFEADTPGGKVFDVLLLVAIMASVGALMLESVKDVNQQYGHVLRIAEWVFTGLFTVEYLLRLWVVRKRMRYALSFFGLVDLMAILPTYLSLFFAGSHSLAVVRAFRLLRAFRVFKLAQFMVEAAGLRKALRGSYPKIAVFLMTVAILVVIFGTTMYLVESGNPDSGFSSIPASVYWAVVTVTTVGYGDIAPVTPLGKAIAACMMVMGYALIVVPTGVITAELTKGDRERFAKASTHHCPNCSTEGHAEDASYCYVCGCQLNDEKT